MFRELRFIGLLILHTAIAVILPAIAEHAILGKLAPAHSVVGVLWKESILDALCAACIGFGACRIWRTSAAKWTWLLAALWFAFGLRMVHGDVFGSVLPHRSGVLAAPDARSFFAFTVPLIRTIFYSLGAYISFLVWGSVTRTQAG
jgi:hypothetical protein